MAVLVEALTLVVPAHVLAVSYAGGADAFCDAMLRLEQPPRYVCNGDPYLINASFYDARHIGAAVTLLTDSGVVSVDEGRFHELACLDQRLGPTLPCDWLEWRQHRSGYTYAWFAGTEPGDLAAPDGWTVKQSRDLVWKDFRDEPGRCLRVAEDGERESLLDFVTGEVVDGIPKRHPAPVVPPTPLPEPVERGPAQGEASRAGRGALLSVVLRALDERGWTFDRVNASGAAGRVHDDDATYDVFMFTDDESSIVRCSCSFPARVPEGRRLAVVEALNRANMGGLLGNFELDPEDGEVRFRQGAMVNAETFAPANVHEMLSMALAMAERYHAAVMRVAFGDADPQAAIAEVEDAGE